MKFNNIPLILHCLDDLKGETINAAVAGADSYALEFVRDLVGALSLLLVTDERTAGKAPDEKLALARSELVGILAMPEHIAQDKVAKAIVEFGDAVDAYIAEFK